MLRLLRRALPDRRDQQHLLPHAERADGSTAGRRQVPAGFTFVLKAPQRITHSQRLRGRRRARCATSATTARALGGRARARCCSSSRRTSRRTPARLRDVPRAAAARTCAPPSSSATRPGSTTRSTRALRARATPRSASPTPTTAPTPAVATADWGYLRLRAADYTDDDLRGWLATMRRIGERWRDAFVFFKHEDGAPAPRSARAWQSCSNRRRLRPNRMDDSSPSMTPDELVGRLVQPLPGLRRAPGRSRELADEDERAPTLCRAFSEFSDLLPRALRGAAARAAAGARLGPGRVHGRARLRAGRGHRDLLPRERGRRALPLTTSNAS